MLPSRLSSALSSSWAVGRSACMTILTRSCSNQSTGSKGDKTLITYKLENSNNQSDMYATKSPYKDPGPRRYGFVKKYMTEGVLPRDGRPVRSMPPHAVENEWTNEKATFGRNDYIDILGDGGIHPASLLKGPRWLLQFQGNEHEKLMRQMEWEGRRLKKMNPSEHNRIEKRIRYLSRKLNTKRKNRWDD